MTADWRCVLRHHEEQVELGAGAYVLGRSADCDVVLRDPSISRRHASLLLRGGRLTLADLGSSNGTFIDGERVEATTRITGPCTVRLGKYELALELRVAPQSDGTTPPDPFGEATLSLQQASVDLATRTIVIDQMQKLRQGEPGETTGDDDRDEPDEEPDTQPLKPVG